MKIGIIGLGWLGLPLAQSLQHLGHKVIGSTTSPAKITELVGKGIEVVCFKLDPFPFGIGFQKLFETNILILTIPPRSKHQSGEFYLEQLKFLKDLVANSIVKKVVFISSTGIYPKESRAMPFHEGEKLTQENAGNLTLLKAENIFKSNNSFESTIIRFGGLMGENRIPITYSSGKENVDGESRVNYIHQYDAIRLIEWIISNKLWIRIFNGVAPIHPKKREIFKSNAEILGLALPKSYQITDSKEQRLIESKAILETGFIFKYPNPIDFPYQKNN